MKKVITKKYSNGQLKYRKTYNDKNSYLEEYWYELGNLKERANYKNYQLDGLYQTFYQNGQRKERSNWKNGIKDGDVEEWTEAGLLLNSYTCQNGVPDRYYQYLLSKEGKKGIFGKLFS